MKRTDILEAANTAVTIDRNATHGEAENNFALIATYWSAHLDTAVSASDVAIMMTLFKLARAKGNRAHMDNYIDAAGYVAIGGEIGQ